MTPETLPIDQYEQQLAEKAARLRQMMLAFQAPEAQIFRSQPAHYRMRAEFRIWHDEDDLYHIMFDPQTKARIRIDHFMPGSPLINALMAEMMTAIRPEPLLRAKLFQIDYLTTQSGEAVVTLIYHRPLDDAWRECAAGLRDALRARGYHIQFIGRANKTKIYLDRDYVDERLTVAGRTLIYQQIENSFTQPNAGINVHMLEWALAATEGAQGDLLELYCGNGNFSLALARHFDRVLATEIAKLSVEAAHYNIAANHIDNVQIVRMSAEEFTQAMRKEREFTRLKEIDLQSYRCETIFVDPPRSGLDEATVSMVQAYPQILYISCNPDSLCRNLSTLSTTHTIERLALFDQFPYTHHMECGVLLVRKATAV
ncbi:tRNA (uracil-5)-methyltransferase [Sodalis glossinidius str. 'morsitans']|uniref:tRNA/tmRNA (uracil-C(5))-methyltransferase n=1 Tax=Sodalis glossinidius (strain morsitans) TaxID=343509 RepID=TRMA_SODGM|nr:tRNA (uridine(54)-C5)-methyltransferase TrmA [Sodalis glossinidius]Q2NQZ6.1 RecName: Full=tRNA/tmRNA (uracil-C(5))-methyltransferase; AltName: Full=tRNA (uracil(54)-C(5))-methyltransferase; AltName: Full=tRNA(m5U54)-methyltransferase; Short=RUMT; AltName: Full=tmRNA (uracil(341)-C(5))-methyltransferase [Sodalis glossinidius str. 'morsitans']BAE75429.1 tRNA (uracil-5)-methyltransferase [Sodalis glossinidius str. 'morsitans']